MGGTCVVREEPGKQNPRSCRAQELARSSAQENERRKRALTRLSTNSEIDQTHPERNRDKLLRARTCRSDPIAEALKVESGGMAAGRRQFKEKLRDTDKVTCQASQKVAYGGYTPTVLEKLLNASKVAGYSD